MRSSALGAATLFMRARTGVNLGAVGAEAKRPFRFLICGDPELICTLRGLLLSGHSGDHIPLDAAAVIETVDARGSATLGRSDVKAVLFLGRPGDLAGAKLDVFTALRLPVFALEVDPEADAAGPPSAPVAGTVGRYVVPALDVAALRGRVFPHLVDRCRGVEIAVGRRLPPLREFVAAKLTRDAASTALKMAAASALADNIPVLGFFVGAVASASDIVAITGVQLSLVLRIGSAYGRDPDLQRVWELLPVVGGGLGWRALSRELAGFIPVAGVAIKGTIAYAGTIVVGEGATFYYQHGRHMTRPQAAVLYEEAKRTAIGLVRDFVRLVGRKR